MASECPFCKGELGEDDSWGIFQAGLIEIPAGEGDFLRSQTETVRKWEPRVRQHNEDNDRASRVLLCSKTQNLSALKGILTWKLINLAKPGLRWLFGLPSTKSLKRNLKCFKTRWVLESRALSTGKRTKKLRELGEVKLKFWRRIQVTNLIMHAQLQAGCLKLDSCWNPTCSKSHQYKVHFCQTALGHVVSYYRLKPDSSPVWWNSRLCSAVLQRKASVFSPASVFFPQLQSALWQRGSPALTPCCNGQQVWKQPVFHPESDTRVRSTLYDCGTSDSSTDDWLRVKWGGCMAAQSEFPVFLLVMMFSMCFVLTLLRCKWWDQIQIWPYHMSCLWRTMEKRRERAAE